MSDLIVRIADHELDGSEECSRCLHILDLHSEEEFECSADSCDCEGFVEA